MFAHKNIAKLRSKYLEKKTVDFLKTIISQDIE